MLINKPGTFAQAVEVRCFWCYSIVASIRSDSHRISGYRLPANRHRPHWRCDTCKRYLIRIETMVNVKELN